MSDNISHNADATDPWENLEEWDKQRILTAGNILAQTLEFDIDDIFMTCMVALTSSKADRLVKNLDHTKDKYDKFMKEEDKIEERF